jgi:hypothetical protein
MKRYYFVLLKDFGGHKKGKMFDCFDGLVSGLSTPAGSKSFKDREYFKLKEIFRDEKGRFV